MKPTVGDVVYYYPPTAVTPGEPLAAVVTVVGRRSNYGDALREENRFTVDLRVFHRLEDEAVLDVPFTVSPTSGSWSWKA